MNWIYNLKSMLNGKRGKDYVVPKLQEDETFKVSING